MAMPPTENKNETFYNVMPEANVSGPLVNSNPTPVTDAQKISMPGKGFNKKLLFIPLVILVLAGIGAGVWFFVLNKDDSSDITLIDPIVEPTPEANPEVTTPAEWLVKYFQSETCTEINVCGDKADPDRDGLTNKEEHETGTDPNNADSDGEGLSDGDEKKVFNSDPLEAKTYAEGEYNDADFVKGGYDITTNTVYSSERLTEIKGLIKEHGLHQPTLGTLGDAAFSIYSFSDPNAPTPPLPSVEMTPEAKLDRDTQRLVTIKKIGVALVKYKAEKKSYPGGEDFTKMSEEIKPYNTTATNYLDPIGAQQYVYGYQALSTNQDFVLTYFSETQNQLIKYGSVAAIAEAAKESKQANDDQRKMDLESIKSALMIYSNSQLDPNNPSKLYSFPPTDQYKTALAGMFAQGIPTDPVTKQDYIYEVLDVGYDFSLTTTLEAPAAGTTTYVCNRENCVAK